MFSKRIHVFKAGDQTSAQGVQRNFSPKELDEVCQSYDPTVHEAPLVIGHQGDSDSLPSFGWIKGFSRQGDNLYADVDFTDTAKDLVKDGHYRKVSISFYSPDSAINPNPGKWSARHLALLGAAPPAVKGLEPFSFREEDGVFDYATTLDPSKIFSDDLGPTLIVEKGPLEMLKEKLEAVRSDMGQAVEDMKAQQQDQGENQTDEAANNTASPDNPSDNYREHGNSQQLADLEDKFPEDNFMEDHSNKISRKRANGANGQVMQIVENVYDEPHGEMPEAFKKNAAKMKAKAAGKKEENDSFADEHSEVSYKTNPTPGKVSFGKRPEGQSMEQDRMDSTRSDSDSYGNRMSVGKEGKGGVGEDRMNTARSSEQDEDRLNTPKNAEQDKDRKRTAKATDGEIGAAVGVDRWDGQPEARERIMNNDQYDADAASYGINKPGISDGSDPAGRDGGPTPIPTETEETPDNTVFAVDTTNVMDDKDMRVLRKKSSDARTAPKVAQNFGEVDEDNEQGRSKFKKGQLEPGEFEGGVAEIVGPDGAFAEVPRGEKKSSKKQLVPGGMDEVDEAAQVVGPDGAFSEDNLSGDFEGGPNQKVKKSGGAFAEEHREGKKNPYTKTGFGSTYDEDGTEGVEDEDDYKEMSTDHCGMGSMGQAKPSGMESMFEELANLKKENERMKREFNEAKMNMKKEKLASFVEDLYESGKLTDGIMPQHELQSYCEGLEFGTLEFSEGESPATKLLGLLNRLPNMVEYGEVVLGGSFQYAEEDLDPHSRALKLVESDGIDYVEALKRTLYS
jgi:hypothetical protein